MGRFMAGLMSWIGKTVVGAAGGGGGDGAGAGSQEEIPIAGKRVRVLKQLGEGGYAFVYSVEDVETNQLYALKRIICQDEAAVKLADKEIRLLKRFNDPNIVRFFGACRKDLPKGRKEYFILMEHCNSGHLLASIMKRNGQRFPEPTIAAIFLAVCNAIKHLHTQKPKPIAHRDLKLENILLTSRGEFKLCDFGSCTTRAKVYATNAEIAHEEERVGKFTTAMYRAPEMVDLYGKHLVNEKVDIWALGCILFTTAFFEHPFQQAGNLGIINGKYDVPDDNRFSKYLTALIKKLLITDPKKRPNIHRTIELVNEWQQYLMTNKPPSGTVGVFIQKKKSATSPAANTAATAAPRKTANDSKSAPAKSKGVPPPSAAAAAVAATPVASGWAEDEWDPFSGAAAPTAKPTPAPAATATPNRTAAAGSSAVSGGITSLFNQLQWADGKQSASNSAASAASPAPPGGSNLSPMMSPSDGPAPPSPIAESKRLPAPAPAATKRSAAKASAAPAVVSPASDSSSNDDAWAAFEEEGGGSQTLPVVSSNVDWGAFAEEARNASIAGPNHGKPKPAHDSKSAAAAAGANHKKELTVSTAKPANQPHHTPVNTPQPFGAASPATPMTATGSFHVPSGLSALHEDTPTPHHLPTHSGSQTPNPSLLVRGSSQPAGTYGGPSRPASTPPTDQYRIGGGGGGGGSGNSTPSSAASSASASAAPRPGAGVMDFGNLLNKPVVEGSSSASSSPAVRPLTMAEKIAQRKEEERLATALAGFGTPNVSAVAVSAPVAAAAPIFTVTAAASSSSSSSAAASASGSAAGSRPALKPTAGGDAFAFVAGEKNSLLAARNSSSSFSA